MRGTWFNSIPDGASFDATRVYRWKLWRGFEEHDQAYCNFIMLNPSTANETENDATLRRCIRFARDFGYRALVVTNLFAYRSTDPADLYRFPERRRVGVENDEAILTTAWNAGLVICAWGNHGVLARRSTIVRAMLEKNAISLYHLGLTRSGEPLHPLRLSANLRPKIWEVR